MEVVVGVVGIAILTGALLYGTYCLYRIHKITSRWDKNRTVIRISGPVKTSKIVRPKVKRHLRVVK